MPPRSSPSLLPHFLVILYGLAIVYASLQPFAPWITPPPGAPFFLFAPWPPRWTRFDVIANAVAYAPFGFFVALVPRRRPPAGRLSVAIAGAGIGLATWYYWARPGIPARLAAAFPNAHRVLLNKYYVDELYGALFVRGLALGGGQALFQVDRLGVDGGLVNGSAWLTRDVVATVSNLWDRYVVDGLVNLMALILDAASHVFRALQTGLVQRYAWAMLVGVLLMVAAVLWIPIY